MKTLSIDELGKLSKEFKEQQPEEVKSLFQISFTLGDTFTPLNLNGKFAILPTEINNNSSTIIEELEGKFLDFLRLKLEN